MWLDIYRDKKFIYLVYLFIYLFTLHFYFICLFILSLMLTITKQILFTIKNSNKMLIDVNTLVKKPVEHKAFYIQENSRTYKK